MLLFLRLARNASMCLIIYGWRAMEAGVSKHYMTSISLMSLLVSRSLSPYDREGVFCNYVPLLLAKIAKQHVSDLYKRRCLLELEQASTERYGWPMRVKRTSL